LRVFDQILDRLLDRFRIGRPLLTRVQEQHLLSAHEGLVALLAALAIFPRLRVQAADHAYAAALVQGLRAALGQFLPRLNRRPVGLDRPAAVVTPPRPALGGYAKADDRRARWDKPLFRLCPDPTDQLHPVIWNNRSGSI